MMESLILAAAGAVSQGVLWGVMTIGVYITYRLLNYADLTVDGSFTLGGAVSATLILTGVNPFLSVAAATLAGMAAGAVTGLLHTKLEIPAILSGILTMIGLYSVNIRVMGDRSNLSLLRENTVFTMIGDYLPLPQWIVVLAVGIVVCAGVALLLRWFFGTEIGCALRATGHNENMVRALGESTDFTKILGLVLSNALVAFSGALVCQSQGYADVSMGTGTIMIGLASVIIGEVIFHRFDSVAGQLAAVVIGSVIYRIVIAVVLQLGLKSSDLKLLTSVSVVLALSVPVLKKKFAAGKTARKQEEC